MIVVGGFLHQIHSGPHQCVSYNAESIFETQHDQNAKSAHDCKVEIHAIAW